jgi:membrane protein implicated in regulation of membrane protease activity
MEGGAQLLWVIWLVAASACVLIELNTGTFYFLLLAASALIAMAFALLGVPWLVQCFIFAGSLFLLFAFVKPLLRKWVPSPDNLVPQASEKLIGISAYVVQEIAPGKVGQVKVNGEYWSAIADEYVSSGEKVEIIEVRVTKLIVKKG